ncbi:MAG: nucleotidyl transferase AbiEii/AbiGii toxin family protein [Saprospiraceae bacterium]|nr:nucleotidyl transferase AbiEii/AbiGii toxin family protein [Candidatus Brachybacter algidus]
MLRTETIEPGTLDILIKCMKLPSLAPFILVGGTAPSLQYGHRMSIDVDFFGTVDQLDSEAIKTELDSIGNTIFSSESSVMLGFYVNQVKVDIVKYKYKLIENPIIIDSIRMAHPKDIGAMKLAAVSGRGKKKDYYDLFFLLQKYSLSQLMEFNKLKFPDSNEMIILKSIGYFEDADNDADAILFEKISWNEVKRSNNQHLKNYLN